MLWHIWVGSHHQPPSIRSDVLIVMYLRMRCFSFGSSVSVWCSVPHLWCARLLSVCLWITSALIHSFPCSLTSVCIRREVPMRMFLVSCKVRLAYSGFFFVGIDSSPHLQAIVFPSHLIVVCVWHLRSSRLHLIAVHVAGLLHAYMLHSSLCFGWVSACIVLIWLCFFLMLLLNFAVTPLTVQLITDDPVPFPRAVFWAVCCFLFVFHASMRIDASTSPWAA